MDEFNLELVRGDKARGSDVPTNAKEWTAFLVDCGDAMYRTYRGPVGSLQGLTLFQAALKQISGIVASRLAHGVEDDITIVGWNRGAPDVWHAGGPPTPALLERLDDMVSSNAKDIVFGKNDAREGRATSLAESLRDAMVSAVLEFDTDEWNNYKIDVSLVVAVWTADNTGACPQGDDSGGGGDPAFRTITELIHRRNIKFHAVLLDDLKLDVPRQCVSDASTLWARVCGSSEGSRDHNTRSIVQNPFALPLSTRLVSHTDAFKMVRLSGTSRTTSIMVPCHLGSFGVFDMRFHSLTSAAWPRCVGASKWLDVTDSAVLVPKSVGLAAGAGGSKWPDGPGSGGLAAYPELGGDLPDDGLKPYYPKPVGKKESAAPRIVLDEQTVENLKSPVPFRRLYVDINAVVGVAVEFDIDDDSSLSSDPFALALPTRLVDSNPPPSFPHPITPSPPTHRRQVFGRIQIPRMAGGRVADARGVLHATRRDELGGRLEALQGAARRDGRTRRLGPLWIHTVRSNRAASGSLHPVSVEGDRRGPGIFPAGAPVRRRHPAPGMCGRRDGQAPTRVRHWHTVRGEARLLASRSQERPPWGRDEPGGRAPLCRARVDAVGQADARRRRRQQLSRDESGLQAGLGGLQATAQPVDLVPLTSHTPFSPSARVFVLSCHSLVVAGSFVVVVQEAPLQDSRLDLNE